MSKKEDKIKVLFEKARRGDVKEFPTLIRAFSRWLRSSLIEELSQSSARRLLERFLQNLNKLVRQIEKTQNANAKTRAVQMLSRLMETIYSTGDSGTAIKYIKRISLDIERIHEDKAASKSLGDIINLLAELPKQTPAQSQPENNMESPPTRKKRAGCMVASSPPPAPPEPVARTRGKSGRGGEGGAGGAGGGKVRGKGSGKSGRGGGAGGASGGKVGGKGSGKGEEADKRDDVYLGTGVPSFVSPGEEFVVRFAAYVASWRDEVYRRLKVEAPRGEARLGLEACRWLPRTKVTVRLHASDVEVEKAEKSFEWNGRLHILKFDAKVLNEVERKTIILRFDVAVQGLEIIELRPEIDVRPQEPKRRKIPQAFFEEWGTPRSAFASYAKKDRREVLGRVRSVEIATGIDVFVDCLKIRPGKLWKKELEKKIREQDIFWLFWSRNAKESTWVEWEWRKALAEKSLAGIQPHPLEPVDVAPPPEELADLQFGSMYEWYIWDMRTKKRRKIKKKKKTKKKKKIGG